MEKRKIRLRGLKHFVTYFKFSILCLAVGEISLLSKPGGGWRPFGGGGGGGGGTENLIKPLKLPSTVKFAAQADLVKILSVLKNAHYRESNYHQ